MPRQSHHPNNNKSRYVTFVSRLDNNTQFIYTINTDIQDMLHFLQANYTAIFSSYGNITLDHTHHILEGIRYYYADHQQDLPVKIPINIICHTLFPSNDPTSLTNQHTIKHNLLKHIHKTRYEYAIKEQEIIYCEANKTYSRQQIRYFRKRNLVNVYHNTSPQFTYILVQQDRNQKTYKSSIIVLPDNGKLRFYPVQIPKRYYKKDKIKDIVARYTDTQQHLIQEIVKYSIYQSDIKVTNEEITYPPNGIMLLTTEAHNILISNHEYLRARLINIGLAKMYQQCFRKLFPNAANGIINFSDDGLPVLSLNNLHSESHISLLQNFQHCNINARLAYLISIKDCYAVLLYSSTDATSLQIVSKQYYESVILVSDTIIRDSNTSHKVILPEKSLTQITTIPECTHNTNKAESWGVNAFQLESNKNERNTDSIFSRYDYLMCLVMVLLFIIMLITCTYLFYAQSASSKITSIIVMCISIFCTSIASVHLLPKISTKIQEISNSEIEIQNEITSRE